MYELNYINKRALNGLLKRLESKTKQSNHQNHLNPQAQRPKTQTLSHHLHFDPQYGVLDLGSPDLTPLVRRAHVQHQLPHPAVVEVGPNPAMRGLHCQMLLAESPQPNLMTHHHRLRIWNMIQGSCSAIGCVSNKYCIIQLFLL